MKHFPNTLLTLLLSACFMSSPIAYGENVAWDGGDSWGAVAPQREATNGQAKGEVDLLLERFKKRNVRVIERCLENCKDSAGMVRGQVINKPEPVYPSDAKTRRISGEVVVRVVVNEDGRVAAAQVVSGDPQLGNASVAAAKKARFLPTKLSGQPVKVTGVIQYNFVAQ